MTRRPAFTLLEVLLATAIGVLLLAALYVALDVQLTSAQAGRDVVERTTLARSLLSRMAADVSPSLGNIDPARYRSKNKSGGQTTQTTPTTTQPSAPGNTDPNAAGATGNTGSTTPNSGTSTDTAPAEANAVLIGSVRFDLGVQGDATTLTLYVSRLPREVYAVRKDDDLPNARTPVSDLRRITYWLAGGGDAPLGLARQEVKIATSDDAIGPRPPEIADEASHVIAEEVKEVSFSYFDGTAWQESWDGTALGSDGATPIGPPAAIAIVIGIPKIGTGELQYYRHVVAVPVANGTTAQSTAPAAP